MPWVVDAYHAAARKKRLKLPRRTLENAREKLAAAVQGEATVMAKVKTEQADAKELPITDAEHRSIVEKFTTLDAKRWKLFGGEWSHEPGRLEQKRDGATRSALRLLATSPADFDATVRFTILGGSQWRSVGHCRSMSRQDDPTQPPAATDSEQNVYVSAVSGGPKSRPRFNAVASGSIRPSAGRAMPIELNQRIHVTRAGARDTRSTPRSNGEPVIAWDRRWRDANGAASDDFRRAGGVSRSDDRAARSGGRAPRSRTRRRRIRR